MLAIPIFLPLISGFVLFLLATAGHKWQEGITKKLSVAVMGIVLLTAVFHGINLYGKSPAVTIWKLKEDIPLLLHLDDLGTVFSTLVVFVWILITLYTFSYMKGDKKGARFLGCHLMTLGMLMGITSAGNLVTMYLFYEGMTLATIGYVIHAQTKEAIAAGYKYVFYSIAGAFLGLIGFFYIYQLTPSIAFTPGGNFTHAAIAGHEMTLQLAVLGMIIGFGSKAGMFPLHGRRVSAGRLWREGRRISASHLAAKGTSGRSGTGECNFVGRQYEDGGYCHPSCRLLYRGSGFPLEVVCAVYRDRSDAAYGIYGFNAGFQGKDYEAPACVFNRKSGFLHFVWNHAVAAGGLCWGDAACDIPFGH